MPVGNTETGVESSCHGNGIQTASISHSRPICTMISARQTTPSTPADRYRPTT